MLIIKAGGGKNINWDYICEDLAFLSKEVDCVLVHGASYKRDEIASKLAHPTRTIMSPSGISSVYTDEEGIEIFLMVYAGLMNKLIVSKLLKLGVNAVGLSGVDGRIFEGKRKPNVLSIERGKTKLLKNNLTGKVEKINTKLIQLILKNGFMPVICPPAISYDNEIINVDGDMCAAILASRLKAEKIVVLFTAPGLLRKVDDETSTVEKIDKRKIDEYMKYAKGRMKKKLLGAKEALAAGVKSIYWGDGRVKKPIINVLKGSGTVIS